MLVDYVPTVLMTGFAAAFNNYLKVHGFKVKQQYLVHSLFCLIAFLLTIPDIISLYNDFTGSYNLVENSGWWATRWLMCYELFYMIEYCDGRIDPNDIIRHLYTFCMLWLSYTYINEGALYGAYLGLVVCLPELLSSIIMFIWAELNWISIYTFKDSIYIINNIYRISICVIYISLSLTCSIWISTYNGLIIWNFIFAVIHFIENINSSWSNLKEPYEACVRLSGLNN